MDGRFFVHKVLPMLLAIGNLSVFIFVTELSHGLIEKQARHKLLYNSYQYFNRYCLCLYLHVVAKLIQL